MEATLTRRRGCNVQRHTCKDGYGGNADKKMGAMIRDILAKTKMITWTKKKMTMKRRCCWCLVTIVNEDLVP